MQLMTLTIKTLATKCHHCGRNWMLMIQMDLIGNQLVIYRQSDIKRVPPPQTWHWHRENSKNKKNPILAQKIELDQARSHQTKMKNILTLVFFACSVFRRDILTTVVKERYFSRKDWNCVNGLSFCQPAIRSKCKRRQILSQQYFSSPVRQFVIVFSILSCQHHHQHHWILFTTNWNTVSHFGSQKNVWKLPSLQVSQKFTCCRREKDWQHE